MNSFYKDITILNREQHKLLKLKQSSDCVFAKNMHLVPLAAVEFFQAARHYPIVFIGEDEDMVPVALLGLTQDENQFIDNDNQWQTNIYIPAFIRRYPFVLAEAQDSNFTVCFDNTYNGWNEHDGRNLFNQQGENSEFLDEMIQFLQNFTEEMKRTRGFISKLQQLQLLAPRTIQLTHNSGQRFVLTDFNVVNEEKFLQLSEPQILDLHKQGFLGIIYAHLMSQGNANQLFASYLEKKNRANKMTEHSSGETDSKTINIKEKEKTRKK